MTRLDDYSFLYPLRLLSLMLVAITVLATGSFVAAQEIVGTSTVGPRMNHIFTLRIPSGSCHPNPAFYSPVTTLNCTMDADTLPVGPGIFYQFGIFDTGSNTVALNNIPAVDSQGGVLFYSTADFLDLCVPGVGVDCAAPVGNPPRVPFLPNLDMRLWGLGAINPANGGAPLDSPQAELGNLVPRLSPILVNLIGAPVANNVVTYVDLTTVIGNNYTPVPGADITFYNVGDPSIPIPLYELELARFGDTSPTIEGANRGSFYSVVNFAFNYNGASVATGDILTLPPTAPVPTRQARVFLDTGNTTTQVTKPVADALGITAATPIDATLGINLPGGNVVTVACYAISNAVFAGIGGAHQYVISSPLICVRDVEFFGLSSDPHDIILGNNYFEQTQVLLDGPSNRLGLFRGVSANNPPIADAGPDQVLECTSSAGAVAELDGSGSSDPDGDDSLSYDWTGPFGNAAGVSPSVSLSNGVHTVTLTVDDGNGAMDSDEVAITVQDTTTPSLDLSVSPQVLWPPNHNMVLVDINAAATDECSPAPDIALTLVESSEGDNTDTFDPAFDVTVVEGRKGGDIQLIDGQLYLRAERSGKSDGRTYTITYSATDDDGNSTTATATVDVPHNR